MDTDLALRSESQKPSSDPPPPSPRQGSPGKRTLVSSVSDGVQQGRSDSPSPAPMNTAPQAAAIATPPTVESTALAFRPDLALQESGGESSAQDSQAQTSTQESADKAPGASASPQANASVDSAAIAAYRRHIASNGWASEAEIASLAESAGVKVVIHHYSADHLYQYAVTLGSGGTTFHLRHMGGHYDVMGPTGEIIHIPGDGNCGFAAFFRAVTGMMPTEGNVQELRAHAAADLSDEQVENILGAMDEGDVDMLGLMDEDATSVADPEVLAVLTSMLEQLDAMEPAEAQDQTGPEVLPEVVETAQSAEAAHAPVSEDPAPTSEEASEDEVASEIAQSVVDGQIEYLEANDQRIEQAVDERLAQEEEEESASSSAEDAVAQQQQHPPQPPPQPPAQVQAPAVNPYANVTMKTEPSTELLEQGLDTTGKISDATGLIGTEGGSNFGTKNQPFSNTVADWADPKTDAALSGNSDIVGALADAMAIGIKLAKAVETLKNEEATSEEKAKAVVDIASSLTGAISDVGKVLGGTFYQIEQIGGQSNDSNFGFTATGGSTLSTDAKLIGDVGGLATNLLGIVGDAISTVNDYKTGALTKGGALETTGRVGLTLAKAVDKLGQAARHLGLIIGQIEGGGQIVTSAISPGFAAFAMHAVPAVGAAVSAMQIGRQGYNIHKQRGRRQRLKAMLQSEEFTDEQREAIQFIRENQQKRINRAGLEIALEATSMVGSIATATGPVGAAVGVPLTVASGVGRLVAVGTRVAKQKLRDKKAKKRDKQGNHESHADWAARQKGKGTVKARLNVLVTPNWDKNTQAKNKRYLEQAIVIAQMDDAEVYRNMGLDKADLDTKSPQEKADAIIAALRKR